MSENPISQRIDELNHHGVLGMKWYVRRYQKYPAGYSGDGVYIGPDGSPRKPTFKERRERRKFNKLQNVIDNATVTAVINGDKRMMKALKPTMDSSTFDRHMHELSKNGAQINAYNGNPRGLREYKSDLTKQEYKYYKNLSKFVKASNNLDPKVMKKRMGKITDADLSRVSSRIDLIPGMTKSINDLKRERNTTRTKADKVANAIKEGTKIVVATGASVAAVYALMNNLDNIAKFVNNRSVRQGARIANKLVQKPSIEALDKVRDKLTNEQIDDVSRAIYLDKKGIISKAKLEGNTEILTKYAPVLSKKDWEELDKMAKVIGGIKLKDDKNED